MSLDLRFTTEEQAAWVDLRRRTAEHPGIAHVVPPILLSAIDREMAPLNEHLAQELQRIRQRERCPSPEALGLRLD